MAEKKLGIKDLIEMKKKGEKVAAIVTYTKPNAILAGKAGMDWLLAPGDSVGPSLLEWDDTVPVTEDVIELFAKAVRKGALNTMRVWDLTFGSYDNPVDAVASAKRAHKTAGVSMVKLEGGECVVEEIKAIVKKKRKVMGHIGLTPQTAGFGDGYIVQGETAEKAMEVILDARAIAKAGVSAILVEAVPEEVAKVITEELDIPIFGIGAGRYVDGQLLLDVDLLGLSTVFNPTFVKCYVPQAIGVINEVNRLKYLNGEKEVPVILANIIFYAFKEYVREVKAGIFPAKEHCYHMKDGEYEKLKNLLREEKEGIENEKASKIVNKM